MTRTQERLALTCLLAVGAATAVGVSLSLGPAARLAPLVIGVPTLGLLLLELARDFKAPGTPSTPAETTTGEGPLVLWLLGLVAATALAGVIVAVPVWLAAFLRGRTRDRWPVAIGFAAGLFVVLLVVLVELLRVRLDAGAVWRWSA